MDTFRGVADNGRVAFIVDDLSSVDGWRVRCLEIRGHADALESPTDVAGGSDAPIIRIHPRRIISFGIDDPDREPQAHPEQPRRAGAIRRPSGQAQMSSTGIGGARAAIAGIHSVR